MELICFGFCDVRRSVFDLAHSFPQDGFRQPEQHPRRALRGGWTPGIRHLGHAHRFLPQSCRHRPELVASTAERLGEWPGGRLRHRPIERAQFVRCKSDLRIPLSIAQKLGTTQEATFAGNGVSSVPLVFSPLARRTTERSGVVRASGNEVCALLDKTGARHCLVVSSAPRSQGSFSLASLRETSNAATGTGLGGHDLHRRLSARSAAKKTLRALQPVLLRWTRRSCPPSRAATVAPHHIPPLAKRHGALPNADAALAVGVAVGWPLFGAVGRRGTEVARPNSKPTDL